MNKLLLCLLTCGLLITTLAKAETILYCQDELATGLIKKNGSWETGSFNLDRYTVKFNDDYSRAEGLTATPMECTAPFPYQYPDLVNCVHSYGSYQTFNYDKKKRRYTFSGISSFGYILDDGTPDTETLSAGTCETF